MNDGYEKNNEPLIEGMDSIPKDAFKAVEPSPELRERILTRTTHIVGRRSRRRRLAALTLVAAAYLLGITTAFLLWGPSALDDAGEGGGAVTESSDNETGEGTEAGKGTEAGEGTAEAFPGPDELVQQSESAPRGERVRLLKQAGDRYLSESYDVEKALACYRQLLDDMSPAQLTEVTLEDTWLLAALKDSRRY